ncbi:WecB/TagA/CpsF family glycosyltransferase [bacterium]|nr:WecB/TagA/CpsF family glycosyltransferase [bacterium]
MKNAPNKPSYKVLGVPLQLHSMRSAVDEALHALRGSSCTQLITPNTEMVMQSRRNSALRAALRSAYISVVDGVGLVWSLRFLYGARTERVTGVDLVQEIIAQMNSQLPGGRVLFLGRADGLDPKSAQKAAAKLQATYKKLHIVGESIAHQTAAPEIVHKFKPDLLVVCFGVPAEEVWINQYREQLTGVKLAIGAGGTADFIAGVQKRAPRIWQKLGLEWLYRLIRQPKRIVRQLAIPYFMWLVVLSKFRQQK